eukprot:4153189-Alexandrium_andersonii.AAC.1
MELGTGVPGSESWSRRGELLGLTDGARRGELLGSPSSSSARGAPWTRGRSLGRGLLGAKLELA